MELPFKLILGSASPRRKKLLEDMDIPFTVRVNPVDESYPSNLEGPGIATYIAKIKAESFKDTLNPGEVVLTADTIVCADDMVLQKPATEDEAVKMLENLSGGWHEVITGICLYSHEEQQVKHAVTRVKFTHLNNYITNYYVNQFKPLDKAGGYGIQEWIGLVGIERIEGSYTNVVGLPTQLVYKTLMDMAG